MNDAEKLSPMVNTVKIGIRELEDLEIWPLSIADQKTMTKEIAEAIQLYFQQEGREEDKGEGADKAKKKNDQPFESDIGFVEFLIEMITNNLVKIIQKATDHTSGNKAEKLLGKITNNQACDIARVIYEQNFESASKNVKSLLDKIGTTFLSKRLSPQFAPNTDIDSSTSADSPTEKAE